MFKSRCQKALLQLKGIVILRATPTPINRPLECLRFSTITSNQHSFTESYFINKFGFSPESALKAAKRVHFETPENPDSVLSFFRNYGFSNSQIQNIIRTDPRLLSCDPDRRVLPKIEFLLSRGASTSDIVHMVTNGSIILQRSLENHIIPSYELLKGILRSDEQTIACIKSYTQLLFPSRIHSNVKLLRDNGVPDSNIARLLLKRPSVLCSVDLGKAVDELLQLGFNPSKAVFSLALIAKKAVSKHQWDAKIDAYKKWGWSEEVILEAFRRQPHCMLSSTVKINAVMSFWVKDLGWDSLSLAKRPQIVGLSLEKTIIPRASVLQVLISKGFMKKNASLLTPFRISEDVFLEKFVKRFSEETSRLLKVYEGKMNLEK